MTKPTPADVEPVGQPSSKKLEVEVGGAWVDVTALAVAEQANYAQALAEYTPIREGEGE